jgi:hypothetical protein
MRHGRKSKKRKLKERRGETFDIVQSLVVALLVCV